MREEGGVDVERALEIRQRLVGLAHLRVEQLAELGQELLPVGVRDGDLEGAGEGGAELCQFALFL